MDHIIGAGRTPTPGTGSKNALIKDSNLESFAADVIEASMKTPVLVDFWAPWCGPCKQLTPILEKVVTALNGAVRLVKINIDENQAIAQQLRIQSIPAVYAFKNGQPVDGFMGALPESQVKAFIQRLGVSEAPSGGLEELLQHAKTALEAGDPTTAAQIFAHILQEQPGEPAAIAGLARCYTATGDIKRAKETLALIPPDSKNHAQIRSAEALVTLAEEAGALSDPASYRQHIDSNPTDSETRFKLALANFAHGQKADAIATLLDLMRRDRKWNDDAARKKLLTLFEALGPDDPLTLEGRRKMSSILFS